MRSLLALSLVAACLLACPVSAIAKGEAPPDKVRFVMSWLPNIDYAPFVIGMKKGFFKEAGIDLTLHPAKGGVLSAQMVAKGDFPLGLSSAESILIARTKGAPLKVVAVLFQKPFTAVVSLPGAKIRTPKDLEGKKVASDLASAKHIQFLALCRKAGVDVAKIQLVSTAGVTPASLVGGQVDALVDASYRARALYKDMKIEVSIMDIAEQGVDLFSHSIITTDQVLRERPELVRRFTKAALKAWEYAVAHRQETMDAYFEAYPSQNRAVDIEMFDGAHALVATEVTKKHGLGYQSLERWSALQELLLALKMIDKKIDPKDVFTNDYLKQ